MSEKKPSLCPDCQTLVDQSDLEWALCGGVSVGLKTYPEVWRLRDKGETAAVKEKTKLLQQLASAMKRISKLEKETAEK